MSETWLHQHPPMAVNPFYGKKDDPHGTRYIRGSAHRVPYTTTDVVRVVRLNKAQKKDRRRLRMASRMFDFARLAMWLRRGGTDLDSVFGYVAAGIAARHWQGRLQALRARL